MNRIVCFWGNLGVLIPLDHSGREVGPIAPKKSSRRNRPVPRERLLASATSLFTTEGIRVIGIDRILREADVAKASLYSL